MPTLSRTIPDLLNGLTLTAGSRGLREIRFGCDGEAGDDAPILLESERQLREYFEGRRLAFDLELEPVGTRFQLDVWQAVAAIPYGETRTYREVAQTVGSPKGFRAMGQANGRNPLPIVIPCHRVINTGGKLGGYGGGLDIKKTLLELEQRYAFQLRETTA
jgi:methylated-DNA-[protein]-cysteine S-methyltransferase